MPRIPEYKCLLCGKPLVGRSDKKFCNDFCRNNYNNRLKRKSTNIVRNTNNVLIKNRRILEELIPEEKETTRVTKEKLIENGFNFKYLTHLYTNKKGNTYFFCYEMGYLPLDNEWYLIVKQKEN